MSINFNTIFIVNDISATALDLTSKLPKHSYRVIRNQDITKDEFQQDEAKLAIKEAYLASSTKKYIILCGKVFRNEAQNALLKILEESPPNIIFILITESKTSILPTIFSRLYVQYAKTPVKKNPSGLNIHKLDLKEVFSFLKQNQRISKYEAKELLESLLLELVENNLHLSQKELDLFTKSIRLLELNSRPSAVISTVLMSLVYAKGKK